MTFPRTLRQKDVRPETESEGAGSRPSAGPIPGPMSLLPSCFFLFFMVLLAVRWFPRPHRIVYVRARTCSQSSYSPPSHFLPFAISFFLLSLQRPVTWLRKEGVLLRCSLRSQTSLRSGHWPPEVMANTQENLFPFIFNKIFRGQGCIIPILQLMELRIKFTLLQNLSSWLWAMELASLLSVSVVDVPPGSITGLRMTQFLFPRLSSSETLDSKMPYHNLFFLPFSVLPNSLFFYKLNIKGSGTEQNKLFFRLLPLQQTFKMCLPLWAPL